MHIKILYFARLRETFALDHELLELPAGARIADLLDVLRARGGHWASELAPGRSYRVALNQELAEIDAALHENAEVALFPPVTGG